MFLRSRIVQNENLSAGGAMRTDDLPVNPLSAIFFTLIGQHTAQFVQATWAQIMADIAKVEVIYKGQSIISGSLADLCAMYYHLTGYFPFHGRNSTQAATANWYLTIPILFGPKPHQDEWCFPAVRRGELQMQTTPGAAFTGQSAVKLQVECLELLDAAPKRFLKYTTMSKTPSATGDHDVDMPLGNPIRGLQLFSTTVPTDAAVTTSISQLRLLVDNVEHGYAFTNWESLRGESAFYRDQPWVSAELYGRLTGGAPAANDFGRPLEHQNSFLANYAFMNYAPFNQDNNRLMTEGKGRVHLRINAGDTQPIRIMPIEEITIQGSSA